MVRQVTFEDIVPSCRGTPASGLGMMAGALWRFDGAGRRQSNTMSKYTEAGWVNVALLTIDTQRDFTLAALSPRSPAR